MSSPPLRVFLTREQDRMLFELRKADAVPQRTKDRAEVIRLSSQGWKVKKIADYFHWRESTVRAALQRWMGQGLEGLWDKRRSGRKRTWQPEDIEYLEQCLEKEQRTYNSKQLAAKLKQERQVNLSPDLVRHLLKKKESSGNAAANLIKTSKTQN